MGKAPFTVRFEVNAGRHLRALRTYDFKRIVAAIEKSLSHEPQVEAVNRKPLEGAKAWFPFEPPLWELRVGEFRVFYDVENDERIVTIWAVLKKLPEQTTQEILDEDRDN